MNLIVVIISLLGVIVWAYTLMIQAKKNRWVWFFTTLFLSPVALIIFWVLKVLKVIK